MLMICEEGKMKRVIDSFFSFASLFSFVSCCLFVVVVFVLTMFFCGFVV